MSVALLGRRPARQDVETARNRGGLTGRGRSPRARIAGLLLLAGILASGMAGRGLAIASVSSGDAQGRETVVGGPFASARAANFAETWRLSSRDTAQDAPQDCDVRGVVESPADAATLPLGPLTISGWAADLNSADGTGITEVRIALDADPDAGG